MLNELFWSVSGGERKRGYARFDNGFMCLLCNMFSETGIIYNNDGVLCDAERYMKFHIEKEHGSVLLYLASLDRKLTGLSEHQRELMKLFYHGANDAEIQKKLSIGSASTIRQHRFMLKEKERQAKIFVTMAELLKETFNGGEKPAKEEPAARANFEDNYTPNDEIGKIIQKHFEAGRLKTVVMKEKTRLIILREIAKRFEYKRIYTEKEINSMLLEIHEDCITLRRYLVDYGFLARKRDGSSYWLKAKPATKEKRKMDSKKEMKRQYKEMKQEGGIYRIRNTKNDKSLVVATPNLKMITGRIMMLRDGKHMNSALQKDWNKYGEEAFAIEVLETIDQKDEEFKSKLDKAETKWLEKLSPYGDKGYNEIKPKL